MEDDVDGSVHMKIIGHVVLNERKGGISDEMGDVRHVPGNEIVDTNHPKSFANESIAEMGTKKSGTAGDYGRLGKHCVRHIRRTVDCDQRSANRELSIVEDYCFLILRLNPPTNCSTGISNC